MAVKPHCQPKRNDSQAAIINTQEPHATIILSPIIPPPTSIQDLPMPLHRKQRTRAHIIADLSVNHLEYHALQCGFSVERIEADYGYDLQLYSYNDAGELQNGLIYLQLKATDHIEHYQRKAKLAYPFESAHLNLWVDEPMPVILVLFDAQRECAYWVYLQALMNPQLNTLMMQQQTFTINFQTTNIVNQHAVKTWQDYKERVLAQLNGSIQHHA